MKDSPPCRWTNHPHRVLKRFIETKVQPGTPDAVMAQTGKEKKKKDSPLVQKIKLDCNKTQQ
jgi:hypothetical protein